jgi:hypothetical protein
MMFGCMRSPVYSSILLLDMRCVYKCLIFNLELGNRKWDLKRTGILVYSERGNDGGREDRWRTLDSLVITIIRFVIWPGAQMARLHLESRVSWVSWLELWMFFGLLHWFICLNEMGSEDLHLTCRKGMKKPLFYTNHRSWRETLSALIIIGLAAIGYNNI